MKVKSLSDQAKNGKHLFSYTHCNSTPSIKLVSLPNPNMSIMNVQVRRELSNSASPEMSPFLTVEQF